MTSDLPLLSASQIQLFVDCERKWGFRYLENLKTPQHPSAALGTEVHEHQLGPYLLTARGFDFTKPSGEIANTLAPLLPVPQTPGMVVERRFEMPSPTGRFNYQGFIDLYAPDSACVPNLGAGGVPLVGDFKTTSNLAYAQTSETLATNIQAQLYAMAVLFEESTDTVDLVWFYTRTRKPHRAQRVHLRAHAPHVAEQFSRIDEIGQRLVTIKQARPSVEELPPNPRMCDSYGGCPYRHICNLAPPIHAAAVNQEAIEMEAKTNDFLAGLRKTNGTAAPAVTAPVATTVPVASTPAQVDALLSGAHPETISAAQAALASIPKTPVITVAINPPESALPPAPPVGAATPAEPAKRTRRTKAEMETAKTENTLAVAAAGEDLATLTTTFPRTEFAAFLRAWAARIEGAA